jgi:hypothetical protein
VEFVPPQLFSVQVSMLRTPAQWLSQHKPDPSSYCEQMRMLFEAQKSRASLYVTERPHSPGLPPGNWHTSLQPPPIMLEQHCTAAFSKVRAEQTGCVLGVFEECGHPTWSHTEESCGIGTTLSIALLRRDYGLKPHLDSFLYHFVYAHVYTLKHACTGSMHVFIYAHTAL